MRVDNLLTVDVEDWFHICGIEEIIPPSGVARLESRVVNNTLKILNILKQKKARATFFVLGCIAERHPHLIKEIHAHGHEIASHGYRHQRVYTMTPEAFRKDLKKSVNIIYSLTGSAIKGYRAPEWSIRDDSLWALDILRQEGFAYDSSMAPLPIIGNPEYRRTPHVLNLNSGRLWEVPPLVASTPLINLPLGGGWGLRTFPYSLIRSSIRKLNHQGHPALIYLHPREFDPKNPRIRLPLSLQFVLNARVERTEKRLDRLLNDFKFTTVSDRLEQLSSN